MAADRRDAIYNFIVQHFDYHDWERAIEYDEDFHRFETLFPSYVVFQQYQRRIVNALDENALALAEYFKAYIEAKIIQILDQSTMVRTELYGFYYMEGILILCNRE